MTTETVQSQENHPPRAPLPPVEMDTAPHPLVEEHVGMAPEMAVAAHTGPAIAPAAPEQKKEYGGVTGFVIRHPKFTKEPVTYLMYQFARATAATIPYGFGMAAGHHGFGMMSAKGQKMGLTEAGQKLFKEKGALALSALGEAEAKVMYKEGAQAVLGRNMMRLGNSAMNPAVQIALGFTLFRFTGGLVKNLRDRIMNDKNTPEQTAEEVKHAPKTILEAAKINWKAESTGTPIAALVLGFMNAAYTPVSKDLLPIRDVVKNPGFKGFIEQTKEVVFSKPAKLLQNAAVWTLSYSLFFLTAESLFKDKQIQLGRWKGHPNSLKNGPDDTVGGPGAVQFITPEKRQELEDAKLVNASFGSAEEGYKTQQDDDRAHDSQEKLRYPWLTGEPSMGRFLIRRVAPVAVGITAYAALKRVGYLADVKLPGMKHNYIADAEKGIVSGWNGPMEPITLETMGKLKTAGEHTKFYLKNAYREGKATIMFGALWAATDAWGTFYDKFVHNLQKSENAVPLNEHQQEKHAELLGRVNEKLQGQGRAA